MKYTVEHSCGHEAIHELFGPGRERDKKIEWLKSTSCKDCFRSEQEHLRTEESSYAAQKNSDWAAVALVGTQSQIQWAERIRYQVFVALEEASQGEIQELKLFYHRSEKTDAVWKSIHDHFKSVSDAAWWINTFKSLLSPTHPNQLPSRYKLLQSFSPHALNDADTAKLIGMEATFTELQNLNAQEELAREYRLKKDELAERGRALGLKGRVQIWRNERSDVRVYGDDFAFHAKGAYAGQFQNKTGVPDAELMAFCQDILMTSKDISFRC
jgi:hypothetical protein